jgi:NAD(P)-dependent dehydrogenase (short-subunit alcohol dehydrogenase family)
LKPAGAVFVVTGAGSGIGRQVARELVARGATVAAADVNVDGLAETQSLATDPSRITIHQLDISDKDAVERFPSEVLDRHGRVDGLFNIAGVGQSPSAVPDIADAAMERLVQINFWGTAWMTRAFLPALSERPDGAVVMNTSSLSALVPFPGAAIYGASKAAVALFGYGLARDLRASGSKVTVTTALPGTIWTELVRSSAVELGTSEALARRFAMSPERAARKLVNATLRGRMRVIVGKDAHLFSLARRISFALAERLSYLQVGWAVYRRKK